MRRARSLAGKELGHHGLALLALCVLFALALAVATFAALTAKRSATVLESSCILLWTIVPLGAAVLANRLVVAEYHGRTQLFVEALPIRRFEPVAAKYVLGLLVLLAFTAGEIAFFAFLARDTEPVGARFLGILLARGASFVWFVWSFLFAMGFTGRLRIPIFLAIGMGLLAIWSATDFEPMRSAPFVLVDPRSFPTERRAAPIEPIVQTCALALAWTTLAFVLAQIREGSVAEALARRMSQKEKAVVGVLTFAATIGIVHLEERKEKKPYEFTGGAVLESSIAPLEIQYEDSIRLGDAQALLAAAERDLAELARLLPAAPLPVVRVAWSPALDHRTFERAKLEENDGVLVRARFEKRGGFDERGFRAYLIAEVLDHALRGRARFEPKRWFLDGFSRWWVEAGEPRPIDLRSAPLRRALWATRERRIETAGLEHWTRFRERWGGRVAESIAYSGLLALEAQAGRERVLALARALYDRVAGRGPGEVLHERRNRMEALFERETGMVWTRFPVLWNEQLDRWREDPDARAFLDGLPAGRAEIAIETGQGDIRTIVYRFAFASPPPAGTIAALLHRSLPPFDREIGAEEWLREEHVWPAGTREAIWRLDGRYGRGERAFLALEADLPALDGPVRLHAERSDLP